MYLTKVEVYDNPYEALKFFIGLCEWKGLNKIDISEQASHIALTKGIEESVNFVISNLSTLDYKKYIESGKAPDNWSDFISKADV